MTRTIGAGEPAGPHLGIEVNTDGCAGDDLAYCGAPLITVGGDVAWDDVVALAVGRDWAGTEALTGVPGTVADVTARNATAYGTRVGDTVARVRTWDRVGDAQRTFAAADCDFTRDGSRFAARLADGTARYVILDVALLLRQGTLSEPLRDLALAGALGVPRGERVPLTAVRSAIQRAGAGVKGVPTEPGSRQRA